MNELRNMQVQKEEQLSVSQEAEEEFMWKSLTSLLDFLRCFLGSHRDSELKTNKRKNTQIYHSTVKVKMTAELPSNSWDFSVVWNRSLEMNDFKAKHHSSKKN